MKKIVLLAALAIPMILFAQKEIKPSIQKAEKALKAGKLDEAKAIIDVTVSNQEFMVDKKGEPSKKAAEAWFYKAIIYLSIDTCKNEAFKALEPEPFKVAVEAYNKSNELSKGKTDFYRTPEGLPMITQSQIFPFFADSYVKKALDFYQKDKNYKKAFEYVERTLYFIPEDTSIMMNAGVYFGPSAEEYDKSIDYIKKYLAKTEII